MSGAGRYWHTLRHLQPVQVYGRLWFRLHRPRPDRSPAPALREGGGAAPWVAPAARGPAMTGPDRFDMLGQARSLAVHDWDDPAVDKLWRYNLHYFDDLTARDAASRGAWHRALLHRWVAENPPGAGTGWEPYPTSLRIVNWIKWTLAGGELPGECVHSLAVQARWLRRRLEIHLQGNHLFANAKALVFAGCLFEGDEAEDWLATGLSIVGRQLPLQVLADGGQFELSPMYHALALEDVLDLCNVLRARHTRAVMHGEVARALRERVPAMRRWLAAMTHPDGEISLFNDAAIGIAPAPAELDAYARRLGFPEAEALPRPLCVLPSSGYVRLDTGPAVALLDVARVGPDHLPGHAHADTLSFELSLHGRRLFVNGGTSVYGTGEERARQRGTRAHNTVVVDGADSSEVWAGFRVARRARPTGLTVTEGDPMTVECAHDGYLRLPGRVVHRRRWEVTPRSITIHDEVTGRFGRAEARYHLHPDVMVEPVEPGALTAGLTLPEGRRVRVQVLHGRLGIESAAWHPRFGTAIPTTCLTVAAEAGVARLQLEWD